MNENNGHDVELWIPESTRQDIIRGAWREVGASALDGVASLLQEYGIGLADLELAKDDLGWTKLGMPRANQDLTSWSRQELVKRARAYYLRDPLAKQAIRLWTDYSLGRGFAYKAESKRAQAVLDEFWGMRANRNIFSAQGQRKSSNKALVDGEVFFPIFAGAGADVKVRRIDPLEITEILTDPDDIETPVLYKREWWTLQKGLRTAYYRDWMYDGDLDEVPDELGQNQRATEDAMIFHLAINTLGQRGYSLLTPAMDWTKAHRKFLEARASITQALSRFAWKGKSQGGAAQIAAMKSQLKSSHQGGGTTENNPPAAAGATWLENQAFDLQQMKVDTGAKNAEADGRMLKLQVAAGTGIFEHYFGDPSTGNLATSKAMELPMLKMFESYQQVWEDTYGALFEFVLINAGIPPAERYVDIDSPPIIEKDAPAIIEAIAKALTIMPELNTDELRKMMLTTLGINDPDEVLAKIKPADAAGPKLAQALRQYAEALREVPRG